MMLIFAGLLGFFIGSYQVFFQIPVFSNKPFWIRMIVELFAVQVLVIAALLISREVIASGDVPNPSPGVLQRLLHPDNLMFYLKIQLFAATLIFLVELEKILGRHFLIAYIFGRYQNPTREDRFMLFMDLRDSTTITEQLGDERYYHFLNDCFVRIDGAAIRTGAEILKYIGDEVVVSWRRDRVADIDSPLRFFEAFQSEIQRSASYFKETYGVVPRFCAGVHYGSVTVAFLGSMKRQLDFSGDLMNTTARICDASKHRQTDLLISEAVYRFMPGNSKRYIYKEIGKVNLKGKLEEVKLFEVYARSAMASAEFPMR